MSEDVLGLEGLDAALIGDTTRGNGRRVLCYDIEMIILLCMEAQEWSYIEASDHFWTWMRWEFADDFIFISREEDWIDDYTTH